MSFPDSLTGIDRAFHPSEPIGPRSKDVTPKVLRQQEAADQAKIENLARLIDTATLTDNQYEQQIKTIGELTSQEFDKVINHIASLAVAERALGRTTKEHLLQAIPLSAANTWLGDLRLTKQGATASTLYENIINTTAKALTL